MQSNYLTNFAMKESFVGLLMYVDNLDLKGIVFCNLVIKCVDNDMFNRNKQIIILITFIKNF